jgi:hypothetical protein
MQLWTTVSLREEDTRATLDDFNFQLPQVDGVQAGLCMQQIIDSHSKKALCLLEEH